MEAQMKAIWYESARANAVWERGCEPIGGIAGYPGSRIPFETSP
jgi:hypothetical protein